MATGEKSIIKTITRRRFAFFGVFVITLAATYGVLAAVDFLPEPRDDQEEIWLNVERGSEIEESAQDDVSAATKVADPLPVRIIIDELDTDVTVLNPESRKIVDLDAALQDGVVRHPDSADFSDEGHMFLFGHSSYLPTVHNRNYQAFNGIQKLTWGDLVRVQSNDTEYVYRVVDTYEAKASQAEVVLDHSEAQLTLATCNSFGSIDDRFVVEAELISSSPL